MTEHKKHATLAKPGNGNFHRLEFAIMGMPCGGIKALANTLISSLASLKIAYVDADHQGEATGGGIPEVMHEGAWMAYTDKINFGRFDLAHQPLLFQNQRFFDQVDLVLVNGNHFKAAKQILVLDPKKPLEKKIDKITHPVVVITTESQQDIPHQLIEKFPEIDSLPKFSLEDSEGISSWLQLQYEKPPIKGLLLVGGESTRMGKDKSQLAYHGKPQVDHLLDLMKQLEIPSFISSKHEPTAGEQPNPFILDSFIGLGPFGGILSSMREDPKAAWLVVACDLPLVTVDTLQQLIAQRDTSALATAFYNEATGFPDPLITLWEPKAYPMMLHFLSLGYSCPRKVLINAEVKIIHPKRPEEIMNVNTPEDFEKAQAILHG